MQTNFFSAEFGQTGGAVVNMVTKSGTNRFDGTGYYFLRHSTINANDWFSNRAGRTLPIPRRDQAGGVLGGPLIRNKTSSSRCTSSRRRKPAHVDPDRSDAAAETGRLLADEERLRAGDDDLQPVRHLRQCAGEPRTQAVPGNVIPSSMLDPIALKAPRLLPAAEHAEHVDHGDQQLVRAGHLAERQPPDEHQDGSQLLGPEPPERPLQLWSVYDDAAKPFRRTGPRVPLNNGPIEGSVHSFVTEFTRTQSPKSLWSVRYGLTYAPFTRTRWRASISPSSVSRST